MPIIHLDKQANHTLAIWHWTEPLDFFYEQVDVDNDPLLQSIRSYKPFRQFELLSSRYMANMLVGKCVHITKNALRKPSISELPDVNLSISHSGPYSAIMLSKLTSGLDIQLHRNKISRIAPKFMYDQEITACREELSTLHYYWGFKEAVFKAWSLGGVDFKKMIEIEPFDGTQPSFETAITFKHPKVTLQFKGIGQTIDDLYISKVFQHD